MSAWVEDSNEVSGFRWDPDAPPIAQEPAMTLIPAPSSWIDPDQMPPETGGHAHGGDG